MEDTRRDATFLASYKKDKDGNLSLWGTHVQKNIGYINSEGNRVFCGDYAFYRLPWVYLSLAEIANMESDHSGIEKYINLVRKRAYASNWDENKHGYKSGDLLKMSWLYYMKKIKNLFKKGNVGGTCYA